MCYCMSAFCKQTCRYFVMHTHAGVESSTVGDRRLLLLLFPIFCVLEPGSHWMWSSQMGWSGCQQALSILQSLSMFPLLSSPGWHNRCVCMPPCRPFLKSDRDSTHVFMVIQQALYPWLCVFNLLKYLICKIASCVEFFFLYGILTGLSIWVCSQAKWVVGNLVVELWSHIQKAVCYPSLTRKMAFAVFHPPLPFSPWALMCCRYSTCVLM